MYMVIPCKYTECVYIVKSHNDTCTCYMVIIKIMMCYLWADYVAPLQLENKLLWIPLRQAEVQSMTQKMERVSVAAWGWH